MLLWLDFECRKHYFIYITHSETTNRPKQLFVLNHCHHEVCIPCTGQPHPLPPWCRTIHLSNLFSNWCTPLYYIKTSLQTSLSPPKVLWWSPIWAQSCWCSLCTIFYQLMKSWKCCENCQNTSGHQEPTSVLCNSSSVIEGSRDEGCGEDKKLMLMKHHRREWPDFAVIHQDWTFEDWKMMT